MTDNPITDETRAFLNGADILNGPDHVAAAQREALRFMQFAGWSLVQLERELTRYSSPGPSGLARCDVEAGGEARIEALRELIAEMEARGLESWPPPRPETGFARRAREQIEAEDAAALDVETQPPGDPLAALDAREKALAMLDKAIDAIGKSVATIKDADAIILAATTGRVDLPRADRQALADARAWFHLGHILERIMRRLGDAGVCPDARHDKGKPSPLLTALAGPHDHIRQFLK
jgi:hypothetical protein